MTGVATLMVTVPDEDLPAVEAAAEAASLTVAEYLVRAAVRMSVRDAGSRYRAVLAADPDLADEVERVRVLALDRGRKAREASAAHNDEATGALDDQDG
jgi:hypothetical protein